MSEKIYAYLIRLYPSRFRREYTEEVLQLFRDRLRDECGFLRRARLWCDLLSDMAMGLSLAWRNNCREVQATATLSAGSGGVPSFRMLTSEPLRASSIFWGSTLSLTALLVFGFLMSPAPAYFPSRVTRGPVSPIDAVLERLNRATSTESVGGGDARNAERGTGGDVGRSPSLRENEGAAQISPSKVMRGEAVRSNQSTKEAGEVEVARTIPAQVKSNPGRGLVSRSIGTSANPRDGFGAAGLGSQADRAKETKTNPIAETRADGGGRQAATVGGQSSQLAHPENAVTAMMGLFQSHDIVMFGEVHNSKQEYEWLCKLVKSAGFADHVDDIVVEFGNAFYQKTVDRYVAGEDVRFEEVQKSWRNMVADTEPVSPVYGWLYQAVREANLQHPGKRIRLLMGSPLADWERIRTSADLAPYEADREQWYAEVVKRDVLANHHRALLIMGAGHFLRGHDQALRYEIAAQQHRPLPTLDRAHFGPGYIERELRAAGANPYLVVFGTNVIDRQGVADHRFDAWNAPVIVPLANNWAGNLAAQPVVTGGRAASIPITLSEQADAMLYVGPCSALKQVYLSRAELDGTAYGKEMVRRDQIIVGHRVDFQYGEVPECVK